MAQQPPTPVAEDRPVEKCVVAGQVVDARTGQPLRRAVIHLSAAEGQRQSYGATTGAGGRFVIAEVEPGRYRLQATRNGYVRQEHGSRSPDRPGEILTLVPGQRLDDLLLGLTPHAVLAGRVADEDGEAVAGVQVSALRYQYVQGQRQLAAAGRATTNDLGEYRIFGLPPGRYYVRAAYRPGLPMTRRPGVEPEGEEVYAPTFYPGTSDPSRAVSLDLSAGAELRGIHLTLLPTSTYRVRGRVQGFTGVSRGRGAQVMLLPRGTAGFGLTTRRTVQVRDSEGLFEIGAVAPGSYFVVANWSHDNVRYTARQAVEVVNADLDGVELALAQAGSLSGTVRVDGDGSHELGTLTLLLRSQEFPPVGSPGARTKEDGTFLLPNVPQGEYTLHVLGQMSGLYLKSVRMGNRDVLTSGLDLTGGPVSGRLEVVLGSDGGQVEGLVLDEQQEPAAGAIVAAVPEPRRRNQNHLFKTARTNQNGRFTLADISPGDYQLFAWEDIDTGAYRDPEFLLPFEKLGESVSLPPNGRTDTRLRVIPAAEIHARGGLSSPAP